MYRTFRSTKDTYIVDRVIRGRRTHATNVGRAGTMNIYKLYGVTRSGSIPNNELTRGLIKFDLQGLRDDYASHLFSLTSPNFRCVLKLYDVYGGQTTPDNFILSVHPLSRSFDEGVGRDVTYYQDRDICNFLTASSTSVWTLSGANAKGNLGDATADILVSGNLGAGMQQLWMTKSFVIGTEDLEIDITQYVSGVLAGLLPDHGFRISFIENQENDDETRFVKRFATKDAADPTKHPAIIARYDDAVQSNNSNFVFDYTGNLYFYNDVRGTLKNVISNSVELTGTNCLRLRLRTPISGGYYNLTYTGSQYVAAGYPVTGTYVAAVSIPSSDPVIAQKIIQSGSVKFDLIWGSVDGTVGFYTSSMGFTASPPIRGGNSPRPSSYFVNTTNVSQLYKKTDRARIRVHIENADIPYSKFTKTFFATPSTIPESAYYAVRNTVTNETVIDFDDTYNSTRLSSDESSLWFDFDMSNLYEGQLYEFDIMIVENGLKRFYRGASGAFRIESVA